ncbi:MAG: integrase [Neptuniibacter sp. Phe_28]|nr:MAG: integrase [Neptuniibacter sp. Phe_28]
MGKITDKEINKKPDSSDKWLSETAIWGHGSLIVRITPTGERLFYFRYKDATDKRITFPIGSYSRTEATGLLTLPQARQKANELAALHKSGIKNIKEHLEAEQATEIAKRDAELAAIAKAKHIENARISVIELFERWAAVDLINRKDGGKEVRRITEKDILPIIGQLAVEDVRKGHITEVTDKLLARGVNRMAKVTFSLMRQMFRFAVDRDIIEHDPTANIRKAKIGGKEVQRDRVLNEDEIKALHHQLSEAGLLITTEAAVWITFSTCCRIGELLAAKWRDIDLEKCTWFIPEENSKNGKAHTIQLSEFSISQFRRILPISGSSIWCYPNRNNSDHVCSKTVTKQLSDRQRQPEQGKMSNRSSKSGSLILAGGKWTPHDLRRTGATMMTALGVLPEVAERCLNHLEENKVKRTYQRYSYHNEMKEAWRLLGERIELLTLQDASKVITADFRMNR